MKILNVSLRKAISGTRKQVYPVTIGHNILPEGNLHGRLS